MFDHLLRTLKDRLLAPVARTLDSRLSPNAISALALVAGLAAAAAAFSGHRGWACGYWLLNRALDGLDGTHARVHGRESPFGGYLDIVFDFVVYAAIPLAIALGSESRDVALATAILLASFFVNAASWIYLAAILEQRRNGATARGELTTITMPPGLVAGAETFVFYLLFLALPQWQVAIFSVMATLVCGNVVLRLLWAFRQLA